MIITARIIPRLIFFITSPWILSLLILTAAFQLLWMFSIRRRIWRIQVTLWLNKIASKPPSLDFLNAAGIKQTIVSVQLSTAFKLALSPNISSFSHSCFPTVCSAAILGFFVPASCSLWYLIFLFLWSFCSFQRKTFTKQLQKLLCLCVCCVCFCLGWDVPTFWGPLLFQLPDCKNKLTFFHLTSLKWPGTVHLTNNIFAKKLHAV